MSFIPADVQRRVRSLEGLEELEDHHPMPPDEPKDRVARLIINIDLAQINLEEAQGLAADLENAGEEIVLAWKEGRLPKGCDVFGIVPDSCDIFVEEI